MGCVESGYCQRDRHVWAGLAVAELLSRARLAWNYLEEHQINEPKSKIMDAALKLYRETATSSAPYFARSVLAAGKDCPRLFSNLVKGRQEPR